MKKFLRAGAFATAALATIALTGCNTGDTSPAEPTATEEANDRVALAQEEGKLTWYTGVNPSSGETVAKAFEDEYGIEVTVVRLTSSQIAQRFQAEVDSGSVEVDVLSTVDVAFFNAMEEADAIRDLTPEELGDIPDEFVLNPAAVQNLAAPMAVPYNTDVLGEGAIESWDDLLKPELKGNIILTDPRGSRAWAQFWTMALNHPDLGEDYLEAFAAQEYRLVDSGAPGVELLAAGEGAVLVANIVAGIGAVVEAGAPLVNWVAEGPGFGIPTYMSIATEAPNPNAASLFVEWLATEPGSTVLNAAEDAISPLGDLPGTFPAPEGVAPVPSPEQIDKDLPKVLELLGIS